MKKVILIALAAMAVAFGATTREASESMGSLASGPYGGKIRTLISTIRNEIHDFRQQTPLTDAQRDQVKAILQSHKSEIGAQFKKGSEARRNMREAVSQSGPESAETLKASDGIADAAKSRALLLAKISSEVSPILTPEQRQHVGDARARIENMVDGLFPGLSE